MDSKIKYIVLALLAFVNASGQISPPGLGDTKTAFWSALGVKEHLDSLNVLTVYAGMGRISGPDDINLTNKPSIGVLNAEMYHKISKSWKYSYAISYRRQNQYEDSYPYHLEDPSIKQEFRAYGRISYGFKAGVAKYSLTLRQEVREFFDPGFDAQSNELQMRTRLKAGLWLPVGCTGNGITGTAEALLSVSNEHSEGWGNYGYKESRFCLYYTYAPAASHIVVDLGYMNDLMGYGHHVADANYLAVDVVLIDVF